MTAWEASIYQEAFQAFVRFTVCVLIHTNMAQVVNVVTSVSEG